MALSWVFFDVGETLVDEERWWRVLAGEAGLQPHVVWAALGVTIGRGEAQRAVGSPRDRAARRVDRLTCDLGDFYPDAIGCLEGVRALGLRVGLGGNQTAVLRRWAREAALPADVISSAASLGVRGPDLHFFQFVVELAGRAAGEIAYVGDRVDNDVLPAAAAGLVAHSRAPRTMGQVATDAAGGHVRRP